jgi:hypothetical protein
MTTVTACRMVGCASRASPPARFCAPCAADWITLLGDDLEAWGLGIEAPTVTVLDLTTEPEDEMPYLTAELMDEMEAAMSA